MSNVMNRCNKVYS